MDFVVASDVEADHATSRVDADGRAGADADAPGHDAAPALDHGDAGFELGERAGGVVEQHFAGARGKGALADIRPLMKELGVDTATTQYGGFNGARRPGKQAAAEVLPPADRPVEARGAAGGP